tara:strand:- start:279 stop:440 length:162 start_codon:yes stop_codon:yes gene_type:complete
MNKKLKSPKGFIHLYNPQKEGLGTYDINYINAYKRDRGLKKPLNTTNKERYAA